MQIFTTIRSFPKLWEEIHSYHDSVALQRTHPPEAPAFVAIGAGSFQNVHATHQVDLYLIPLAEALDPKARALAIAACAQHFSQNRQQEPRVPYTQYYLMGDTEIANETRRVHQGQSKTFNTLTSLLPVAPDYPIDELLSEELYEYNRDCRQAIHENAPNERMAPETIAVGAATSQDNGRSFVTLYLLPYAQARDPQKRGEAVRELHKLLEHGGPSLIIGTHGIAREVEQVEKLLPKARLR